ncbi:transcription initiation factor TFIID subunit 11-like [Schistocerca gregaria]|uniref:transcription initiation factor TFIID subunit 11-like n=1 Tax=Schistocerca gregaria TaxID=7010 RepID=UPI00211EEEF0|nr:transcription initiation factor TFIID subunit 11-like [Schistocerca gregaria]
MNGSSPLISSIHLSLPSEKQPDPEEAKPGTTESAASADPGASKKKPGSRKRKESSMGVPATRGRKRLDKGAGGAPLKSRQSHAKRVEEEASVDARPAASTDAASQEAGDQYEGDDADDEEDEGSLSDNEKLKRQREEILQIRRVLASKLTPIQECRYEVFRNSKIDAKHIEEILSGLPIKKTKEFTIKIIGAMGKLYAGELVEKSRDVMTEWGDDGPLRPVHIREAHRRMQADHQLFYIKRKSPFKR